MTRYVCAVLILALLAVPVSAQQSGPVSAPGSTADNPLPASGVAVGSTFTYDYDDDYIMIAGYGWTEEGVPGVAIWDSADGTTYTIRMGGGISIGWWSVSWDVVTDTICIKLPLTLGRNAENHYGPISKWWWFYWI